MSAFGHPARSARVLFGCFWALLGLKKGQTKSTQKHSLGHSEPGAQKHSRSTPWATFQPRPWALLQMAAGIVMTLNQSQNSEGWNPLSGPVRDTPPYRAIPFRDSIAEGVSHPFSLFHRVYTPFVGGIAPPLRMLSKGETLRKGGGGIAPNWTC